MPGQLVHFEFPVRDVEQGVRFYGGLFGWQFQDSGMPGIDYRLVRTGENQGGAVFAGDEGARGPVIYFDTDDIDSSVAKVRELGGEAEDKQPIPGIGWFSRCRDPEGNRFSLFQSDESVPAPGQA